MTTVQMPVPARRVPEQRLAALRLRLAGRVQGVGFRPFVCRMAQRWRIAGSVQNLLGEVEVIAEGEQAALNAFAEALVAQLPPLAHARVTGRECITPADRRGFSILASTAAAHASIFVPPDSFTCADCQREMHDPADRRYGYPFINCTQCGPRYSLIESMPYDRPNTTMAQFSLCAACEAEYRDPDDRRFHAEPVACPVCGPRLSLEQRGREPITANDEALRRAVRLLEGGAVLAVKGVGGYHLMCDACDDAAVAALRVRKGRRDKPLAVMFPESGADGLTAVREHVVVCAPFAEALLSSERPIVLTPQHDRSRLSARIAPGLREVGALLPYSPLHHLLLRAFGAPLVATSGNLTGEPVLCDNQEARERLRPIADAFLHHDRRIARPADDTVMRIIRGRPRPLRIGRGFAPLEFDAPVPVPCPVLAVGGHTKTTIALAWERRIVVSPHIGDMGAVRSEHVFEQVIDDLQKLYGVRAQRVVCDAHPAYATTRWARRCGLPVKSVLHHHAHAASLAGERGNPGPALVFAWDGVGYGADATLWGGETFLGVPGAWTHVASLRPFRLPGGESAARAPWRSAAAMCWEAQLDWRANPADPLVAQAWRQQVNVPQSSAAGRLFDAAAAIVLGVHHTTFEGQGPMLLEAQAQTFVDPEAPAEPLPLYEEQSGLLRIDWAPLLAGLLDDGASIQARAHRMHAVLGATITAVAVRIGERHAYRAVGLTGGVFQNRLLTEMVAARLERRGIDVWLHERIPCNDGGLSFGQLIEAGASGADD